MAKRTTQVMAMVEYVPQQTARTTQMLAMVEYVPVSAIRTTQQLAMVEYVVNPIILAGSVGPAGQTM